MKNLALLLLMIALSNAGMAQGSSSDIRIMETSVTVPGGGIKNLFYKGRYVGYFGSTFVIKCELKVNTPVRIKCSLYVMKKDYADDGKRGYMQGLNEYPSGINDFTHLEKIYETAITTVTTTDDYVEWDWDGYTWKIDGVRYPVRDWVVAIPEDADTGELLLKDEWKQPQTGLPFQSINRYHFSPSFLWNPTNIQFRLMFFLLAIFRLKMLQYL